MDEEKITLAMGKLPAKPLDFRNNSLGVNADHPVDEQGVGDRVQKVLDDFAEIRATKTPPKAPASLRAPHSAPTRFSPSYATIQSRKTHLDTPTLALIPPSTPHSLLGPTGSPVIKINTPYGGAYDVPMWSSSPFGPSHNMDMKKAAEDPDIKRDTPSKIESDNQSSPDPWVSHGSHDKPRSFKLKLGSHVLDQLSPSLARSVSGKGKKDRGSTSLLFVGDKTKKVGEKQKSGYPSPEPSPLGDSFTLGKENNATQSMP